MNQILDFGGGNNDNNNYEKPKKPINEKKVKNSPIEMGNYEYNNTYGSDKSSENSFNNSNTKVKSPISDKIIKVFAFLMIILAIALIISGVTSIFKNKKDTENNASSTPKVEQVQADILAELDEETGKVTISVTSPVEISKMIYSWDQDHDNVVSGDKQTTLQEEVVAPHGEHTLYVQVIDEDKNKTTKDFTFNSESGVDTTEPEITLTVTEDKKLEVEAVDDTSIAYVTYSWNDGEEVTMTPEEETSDYKFELDIPKGKNTIVVIAVDGSDSSNAKIATKTLEGITKPEINYGFLDQTGAVLQITCSHEDGIQSINYTLNGQEYSWEAQEGEEATKELTFQQNSVEGYNEMKLTVTSVDGATAEFNANWNYTPQTTGTDENETENAGENTNEVGQTSENTINN